MGSLCGAREKIMRSVLDWEAILRRATLVDSTLKNSREEQDWARLVGYRG